MAYVGDALSEYPDVLPGCVGHISMAYHGDALSEYPVVLPGCVGFLFGAAFSGMYLSVRSCLVGYRRRWPLGCEYDRLILFQRLVIVSWHSGAAGMMPDPQGGSAEKGKPSQ